MPTFTQKEYFKCLKELLETGQTVQVPVRGMSMFPFLMQDDIILVKPAQMGELKKGSVLLYERKGQWVAHRLVRVDKKNCILRGDGNKYIDGPVPINDVKGIATGVVSSRLFLAKYAFGKLGRLMAKTGPVTGWIFYYTGVVGYKVVQGYRWVWRG